MPRNLEFKSRIPSTSAAIRTARSLNARHYGIFAQRDTYFRVSSGRLKLREMSDRSELIRYFRPNSRGTRISKYLVVPVRYPREMRRALTAAFGVLVVVMKKRSLFLLNNARIHIDTVRGLGTFIEFEVIVKSGLPQARQLTNRLLTAFGLSRRDGLAFSYSDLLLRNRQ